MTSSEDSPDLPASARSPEIPRWEDWDRLGVLINREDLTQAAREGLGSFCRKLNELDPRATARYFLYETTTIGTTLWSELTRHPRFKFIPLHAAEPLRPYPSLPFESHWTSFGPTAFGPLLIHEFGTKQFVRGIKTLRNLFFGDLVSNRKVSYGTDRFLSLTTGQLMASCIGTGLVFSLYEVRRADLADATAAALGALIHYQVGKELIKRIQPGRIAEIEHNVGVVLNEEIIHGKIHQTIAGLLEAKGEGDKTTAEANVVKTYQEVLKAVLKEVKEGTEDIAGLVKKNSQANTCLRRFNLALSVLLIHRHAQAVLAKIGGLGDQDFEKIDSLGKYFKARLGELEERQGETLREYREDL